jgi:beta-phosphoglucomutase
LDGVLTETSRQHYLAWKELADELGIPIDLEFNETLKGVSRMDSLARILARGNRQNDFSDDELVALATKKNDNYQRMIASFTRDDLFEGVYELLVNLKEQGVLLALGSASKNGPRLLDAMGITSLFDCIVDPATVRGKPHPDIFLKACETLGVDPAQAVGVEDAVSGVQAIKAAGMFAIGIGDPVTLHEADIVYAQTKDINCADLKQ